MLINLVMLFVPAAIIARLVHAEGTVVFALAGVGIIPLSAAIANSTEDLARHVGPTVGGLLNATFGNAAELIIAFFAVKEGLLNVVKASISGSILGNSLLVLGVAILAGGIKNGEQRFNRDAVGVQSAMLLVAVAALLIPATFVEASITTDIRPERVHTLPVQWLSLGVAVVLMVVYICGTVFSLKAHSTMFGPIEEKAKPQGSTLRPILMLVVATVFTAILSEILVGEIQSVVTQIGLSELFIGLILVPIIGNAAEHSSAAMLAYRNKVDITFAIAIGSSTQVALLVAPLVVFASFLLGHPLTLIFLGVEIWSILLAVLVVTAISRDGRTNWFEGLMLLACYTVLALSAFFVQVH